jgi:hypothetical protein
VGRASGARAGGAVAGGGTRECANVGPGASGGRGSGRRGWGITRQCSLIAQFRLTRFPDPFSRPVFPVFPTRFPRFPRFPGPVFPGWRVTPSADAKHRLFLRTLDTASGTARIPPRRRLPSGQRRQSGRRRNSCCGAGLAADLINHLVQAGPFCRCVLPYPLRVIDAVQAERLRPAFLMQPVDTSPDALVQRL